MAIAKEKREKKLYEAVCVYISECCSFNLNFPSLIQPFLLFPILGFFFVQITRMAEIILKFSNVQSMVQRSSTFVWILYRIWQSSFCINRLFFKLSPLHSSHFMVDFFCFRFVFSRKLFKMNFCILFLKGWPSSAPFSQCRRKPRTSNLCYKISRTYWAGCRKI